MTNPDHNQMTTPDAQFSQASHIEALRALGRSVLHSIDQDGPIYRQSPPEALLGMLLRLALSDHTKAGRLEILSRERVILPGNPPLDVELDFLIRMPATGAAGAVSIEGHAWHRRSINEHDSEVLRDRRIRRHYPLLRYAAREVLSSPWSVVRDVCEMMRTWPGFADVCVPFHQQLLIDACAESSPLPCEKDVRENGTPTPRRLLDYARTVVAQLTPPPLTDDPAVQLIREGYPRHYACWDEREVRVVRDLFLARVDLDDIAGVLGRTRPAIWAQVRRMGLVDG